MDPREKYFTDELRKFLTEYLWRIFPKNWWRKQSSLLHTKWHDEITLKFFLPPYCIPIVAWHNPILVLLRQLCRISFQSVSEPSFSATTLNLGELEINEVKKDTVSPLNNFQAITLSFNGKIPGHMQVNSSTTSLEAGGEAWIAIVYGNGGLKMILDLCWQDFNFHEWFLFIVGKIQSTLLLLYMKCSVY